MRHALFFLTLILLIALSALVGCRSERSDAESDAASAEAQSSPRIVSISPAMSIILADLGLADRIVGRHGFDRTLDSALPIVGDQTGIDYEAISRVEPTHIIIERGADGLPAMLGSLAAERGWTIIARPMLALGDIPAATNDLAETFADQPDVAARHADLLARFDRAWAGDGALAQRLGRTLVVYWTSPIGVAGPGSFHHDLLVRLGVTALPESGGPYQTLDAEDLRRLTPDSILLLAPDLTDADIDAVRERWKEWEIPAAVRGRVTAIRRWTFLTPSTSMIELAEELRRLAEEEASNGEFDT